MRASVRRAAAARCAVRARRGDRVVLALAAGAGQAHVPARPRDAGAAPRREARGGARRRRQRRRAVPRQGLRVPAGRAEVRGRFLHEFFVAPAAMLAEATAPGGGGRQRVPARDSAGRGARRRRLRARRLRVGALRRRARCREARGGALGDLLPVVGEPPIQQRGVVARVPAAHGVHGASTRKRWPARGTPRSPPSMRISRATSPR